MTEDLSADYERVEAEVLRQCYERIYSEGPHVTAVTVGDCIGVALDDVYTIREEMVGKRLINRQAYFGVDERSHWITSAGIEEAERRGVVDLALVSEHRRVCELILRHLHKVRTEKGWHYPWHPAQDNDISVSAWTLELVLTLLEEDGRINPHPNVDGAYCIAPAGIEQLRVWDDETSPARELDRIEALKAQPRGKALEAVLTEALRRQGCHCEEDTGGKGEQIDLVVECGSAFYLCEAKWLKAPVQPSVVHLMKGRLDERPPVVVGVIFSMSDFTASARKKAAQHARERTILLIGEADTRAIIRGELSFEEIAHNQVRNLVLRGSLS